MSRRLQLRRAVMLISMLAAMVAGVRAQEQVKPAEKPVVIAGKWAMLLDIPNMGTAETTLDLKQDGEKVTGTYTGRYGTYQLTGTLKGRALEFAFTMNAEGTPVSMEFAGEVAADGQSMKGTALLGGLGEATWSAKPSKKL